jgi:radical SAM superfamily enzyme YgiQ (UPF0313 family)
MRALFIVNDIVAAEPLGVMQLATVLSDAGHQVRLAGARQTPMVPLFASFRPELVGYLLATGLHRSLLELNRRLKQRFDFFALFCGPHATFFPEVIEEPGVDAVCIGEGEGAMLDVALALDGPEGGPIGRLMPSKANGNLLRGRCRWSASPWAYVQIAVPGGLVRGYVKPRPGRSSAEPSFIVQSASPHQREHLVSELLRATTRPFAPRHRR